MNPFTSFRQTLKNHSRFTQILFTHLRKVRWDFALAIISVLGAIATDLLAPWPLKIIFDHILLSHPLPQWLSSIGTLAQNNSVTLLLISASAIVILTALNGLFDYGQTFYTSRIGFGLVTALRRELFVHMQQLSLSYHYKNKRGETLTKVVRDANALKDVFTDYGITLITNIITLVSMVVILALVNWRLSLIPLACMPVLFYFSSNMRRKVKQSVKEQRKKEGKVNSKLTENLSTISVVQAFGREKHEAEQFTVQNEANLSESIKIARTSAAVSRLISVITATGVAAVVFVGGWLALSGSLTPGDLFLFVSYVKALFKPIKDLAKLYVKVAQSMISAQRLSEILNTEPAVRDKPNAIVAGRLTGEIEFNNVFFSYDLDNPVLQGANFTVEPGQRVALVGGSGEGKSTVASLLLRLYDPTLGSILIDGIDLREYQRESIRHQVGLVLQDNILFGASVRENITYGKPEATQAEIEEAAQQAHIHDFIMGLPAQYETIIGEMGTTLSGGQRQRIAIARALVKKPSILMLDEPTSALDAESKSMIQYTLENMERKLSMLVIAHQLSTIQHFDKILVLHRGCVVEAGTHEELLARRGEYARLFNMQNGTQVILPKLHGAGINANIITANAVNGNGTNGNGTNGNGTNGNNGHANGAHHTEAPVYQNGNAPIPVAIPA